MTDRKTIGIEVRANRKAKGWTQEELASAAAVSQSLIVKIEKGLNVREDKLTAVLKALGRSFSLTLDPDEPASRSSILAAEQLPTMHDAIAARWLLIFPKLPDRLQSIILEEIALWERKYGAGQ